MDRGTVWLNLGDRYADKDSAKVAGVKDGDLVGLPWRTVLALQADGWFLRSDNIWHNRQTS
jgi:site-specific DNA-methyltransferase (cytosine-N4-specific)